VKKKSSSAQSHGVRAGLFLLTFVLFSSVTLLASCNVSTSSSSPAGAASQADATGTKSAVGEWHDEDQLLLIGATEESQEIVIGHDLEPKKIVREREEQGQKIFGWMVLKNKRVITDTSYSLEANCESHEGEKASLKLSSAITFEVEKPLFRINEEEKAVYQKLGEFDCVASIPGFTARKYELSQDNKYLSLFEENSTEELIQLRRNQ
jgi:hypothetical protein